MKLNKSQLQKNWVCTIGHDMDQENLTFDIETKCCCYSSSNFPQEVPGSRKKNIKKIDRNRFIDFTRVKTNIEQGGNVSSWRYT